MSFLCHLNSCEGFRPANSLAFVKSEEARTGPSSNLPFVYSCSLLSFGRPPIFPTRRSLKSKINRLFILQVQVFFLFLFQGLQFIQVRLWFLQVLLQLFFRFRKGWVTAFNPIPLTKFNWEKLGRRHYGNCFNFVDNPWTILAAPPPSPSTFPPLSHLLPPHISFLILSGLWGFTNSCGDSQASNNDPNGAKWWLNCGLDGGNGWNPANIKLSDIKVISDDEAAKSDTFAPCAKYINEFKSAHQSTGIPVAILMSIAMQESTCNPSVTGGRGEIGMMQITPWVVESGEESCWQWEGTSANHLCLFSSLHIFISLVTSVEMLPTVTTPSSTSRREVNTWLTPSTPSVVTSLRWVVCDRSWASQKHTELLGSCFQEAQPKAFSRNGKRALSLTFSNFLLPQFFRLSVNTTDGPRVCKDQDPVAPKVKTWTTSTVTWTSGSKERTVMETTLEVVNFKANFLR